MSKETIIYYFHGRDVGITRRFISCYVIVGFTRRFISWHVMVGFTQRFISCHVMVGFNRRFIGCHDVVRSRLTKGLLVATVS